ncbi:DUF3793 family protein [Dorea formicigenerans]|jgi:hypothetical protein|uniref:DUF3793 family protein n=1 Tax=Dorea formicigenerans TaxID=39486 RepID=A0A413QLB0_9FIRM|nr:DUF3793 family protein [Dorea formicigenerans]RGS72908.1 DUF3793 family protein [Dorea formicigenerans]RHA00443.1 DUF3793 family protein [Dorea formicigenerans]RHF79555.1 DUF3793 family protein [Dorea formicigenerans]
MSKEVVSYMLSGMDNMKSLQVQLILQCAPFLKGIKIACILNITEENSRELYEILEGTGIKFKILTRNYGKCLVFLYRRESFSRYLKRTDVREFLGSYGYEDVEPEKMLERLSKRVCQYSDGEICFPHEIGAFLDYPIDDVKCFIEKDGKDSLFSGYWKVYNNPGRAKMIFWAYDKAKTSAVNEYLVGKSIRDIACIAA